MLTEHEDAEMLRARDLPILTAQTLTYRAWGLEGTEAIFHRFELIANPLAELICRFGRNGSGERVPALVARIR